MDGQLVDEFISCRNLKEVWYHWVLLWRCGRVIEVLARDEGACFGVGMSFYGTRMDPAIAANVKVPVLFISGDNDPLCPVSVLKDIEKSIGRGSRAVIFEGRGHGFAHELPKKMDMQSRLSWS
ncbi:hypothetical protein L1049_012625 [Liquidambar formosana]|uniref:Carboxymethylenebutenolidase homolog n=1 Tax=Liquidambar formosana TaxID=63359 RepID=A0AAP0R024_LIQFO